jgi:hypothetical protein
MYCHHCGKEVSDKAVVCINCGRSLNNKPVSEKPDAPDIGYAILGFFVPIAGLILYLIWKDETPLRAKSAGKGALISVIVSAALIILYIILIVLIVSTVITTGIASAGNIIM